MADALEQLLQPGEEVRRADGQGRRQVAANCLVIGLALPAVGAMFTALWCFKPDRPILLYI